MQIVGSTFWELLRLVCAERDRFTKLKSSIAETLLTFRSPVPPLRGARLTVRDKRPYDLPQSERLARVEHLIQCFEDKTKQRR